MSMRKVAVGGTLAALVLGVLAGPTAAATSKPAVGFLSPTVTGAEFTTTVTVNRTPKQVSSCAYRVDGGAAASCGAPSALGTKSTSYALDLKNQGDGPHSVTVTVRVTDGGTGTGSVSFTVQPAKVFARAWGDRDGVSGYNASADILIAQLVDTNRSGAIDAGDTMVTANYPTTFDLSASTPSGNTTHVLTSVVYVGTADVEVRAGDAYFEFYDSGYGQYYAEGGNYPGTFYIDYYASQEGDLDFLLVNAGSPGQPGASTGSLFGTPGTTDDPFLELAFGN